MSRNKNEHTHIEMFGSEHPFVRSDIRLIKEDEHLSRCSFIKKYLRGNTQSLDLFFIVAHFLSQQIDGDSLVPACLPYPS